MRRALFVLLALFVLGPPAAALGATGNTGKFARLFHGLAPLNGQSNQQLADLAQTQLDPNADVDNNCPAGTTAGPPCTASGFTYFGQFLDHDLTLDTSPSPVAPVDPTTLTNGRTLRLDLDSVYGGGPTVSPQLYAADRKHFLIQSPNALGARDLPRTPSGQAILVEGRNDENQIIGQIQVMMLAAHNRLIDSGKTFKQAQRILTLHYQWAVLNDFLPHILDPTVAAQLRKPRSLPAGSLAAYLRTLRDTPQKTMVEFSVGAYRFGHSQVRRSYILNDLSDPAPAPTVDVFNPAADDLHGGRPLSKEHQVAWHYFFHEFSADDPEEAQETNVGRRIDPLISSGLFSLPIPGAEASGSNVLGYRNLIRAKFYGMPSGQSVARSLGLPVITPAEMGLGPAFAGGTPLWYYVLAEASRRNGGRTLGPVGSTIVGSTFLAVLSKDPDSILRNHAGFHPRKAIAGSDGVMTLSDLFAFAGVADGPEPGVAPTAAGPVDVPDVPDLQNPAPPPDQEPPGD